jgi:glycerol uptake operon antiterminator
LDLCRRLARFPYCAALTSPADLDEALRSRVELVLVLRGDGTQIAPIVTRIHSAGKLCAIHIDLVDGVAADHQGVHWLFRAHADAVISSHGSVVRAVRSEGLLAIQRLLAHDLASIAHGLTAIERAGPDIVELLPGVLLPQVREYVLPGLRAPLLAGGFIRTRDEATAALQAGALAVTSSSKQLWH